MDISTRTPLERGPRLLRSGTKQHFSKIALASLDAQAAISEFESASMTYRIVLMLRSFGLTKNQISDALKAHPNGSLFRTGRQVVHMLECAQREFETFVMEADRNGAGLKEKLVNLNTKHSA